MRDSRAIILLVSFGMLGAAYVGCGGTSGTGGSGGGGAGGAGSVSSTSHTVAHTTSTSGPASVTSGGNMSSIGAKCSADADCGSGFTCIKADADNPVFAGGPANGYCSKSCMKDTDCGAAGKGVCLTDANNANGTCVSTCQVGPALMYINDPLDDAKCFGRDDVRCAQLDMVTNACLPTCGSDSQCPAGRVCDPRTAVCVTKANTGKASGAKCDPKAMAPECAGVCVSFGGSDTACSSPCVLGGQDIINSPNCGGITKGICAYTVTGNGAGDDGFCALGCTVQDQCQGPTFFCYGVGGLTGKGIDNGFCFGGAACPKGQSDCAMAGGTCTDTKFGKYCLDEQFPLGSFAPDDGGAGDGSVDDGGGMDASPADAASD